MIASKLDAIAFEYNHLLTSQLESQRLYYEGLLQRRAAEGEDKRAAVEERCRGLERELAAAR